MGRKMHLTQRVVGGSAPLKAASGSAAMVFVFAPPTVRPCDAAEVYDFQICGRYFALCAASTCTPTGKQITV